MKVFLSWSGTTSHQIATYLYEWLPMVIQKVVPYISTEIDKGARWSSDIAQELEQCAFGIACVTQENVEAPWLLFEAGALSKSVANGRLSPVLFGLDQTDITKNPISQFQLTKFEKDEILRLLKSINDFSEDGKLDEKVLEGIFEALWPRLKDRVESILSASAKKVGVPKASESESKILSALDELMATTRAMSQLVSAPDRLLPTDYLDYALSRGGGLYDRKLRYPDDFEEPAYLIRRLHDAYHDIETDKLSDDERTKLRRLHDLIIQLERLIGPRRRKAPSMRRRVETVEVTDVPADSGSADG